MTVLRMDQESLRRRNYRQKVLHVCIVLHPKFILGDLHWLTVFLWKNMILFFFSCGYINVVPQTEWVSQNDNGDCVCVNVYSVSGPMLAWLKHTQLGELEQAWLAIIYKWKVNSICGKGTLFRLPGLSLLTCAGLELLAHCDPKQARFSTTSSDSANIHWDALAVSYIKPTACA
jgi:hypothetical protein